MQPSNKLYTCLSFIGLTLACGGDPELELSEPAMADLSHDGTTSAETVGLSDAELDEARFELIEGAVGLEMAERVITPLDNGSEPIYELVLAPGHTLAWYESSPGVVALVEQGFIGRDEPIEGLDGLSLAEQFERFSPLPLPRELEALQARSDEMRPVYEALAAIQEQVPEQVWARAPAADPVIDGEGVFIEPTEDAIGVLRQATVFVGTINPVTSAECISSCDRDRDFFITRTERTSPTSITKSDVLNGWARGCSLRGTVNYHIEKRVWWDWSNVFRNDVTAGRYAAATVGGVLDFDLNSSLRDFRNNAKAAMCMDGDT